MPEVQNKLIKTFLFFQFMTAIYWMPPARAEEPAPSFRIASKNSRAIQKYTGLTWLSERSIEICSDIAAKIFLGGKPQITVRAYSLTDCLSGKFRAFSAELKNCSFRGIPIAHLKIESLNPPQIRLFNSRKVSPGLRAALMVAVSGDIEERDLSMALRSPEIASQIGFLRLQLPGLGDQQLQIIDPELSLSNGRVNIKTGLITANAAKETGVEMEISARPELEGDRFIVLKDSKINCKDIINPEEFACFSQDLLNPLLDFARFDRKNHAFRLNKLEAGEQKFHFAGKLLMVPSPVQVAGKKPAANN